MAHIAGYDITVETNEDSEAARNAAKLLNFYLEKHKAALTTQLLQEWRNFVLYGTTHPERLKEGDSPHG